MKPHLRARALAALLLGMVCASGSSAAAQTLSPVPARPALPAPRVPEAKPPLLKPFTSLFSDLTRVPRKDNLNLLAVGLGAAAAATVVDDKLTQAWSKSPLESFEAGAVVGGTPLQLGLATLTYAIGRSSDSPRVANMGSDLIRAQLLAETLTIGMKRAVGRSRPDGSRFSFPSGHTGVSFASATVLQKHFGWKVGLPAYATAGYVAASRVQMRRHYLSDVAFGAAVGIMAGRSVTIGRTRQFLLTPIAAPSGSGAGIGLTLVR